MVAERLTVGVAGIRPFAADQMRWGKVARLFNLAGIGLIRFAFSR